MAPDSSRSCAVRAEIQTSLPSARIMRCSRTSSCAAPRRPVPVGEDRLALVRVQGAHPAPAGGLLGRNPAELAEALVHEHAAALGVQLDDPDGGVLGERAEAALAAAERLVRVPLHRHVLDGAAHHDTARPTTRARPRVRIWAIPAVRLHHPVGALPGLRILHQRRLEPPLGLAVVRVDPAEELLEPSGRPRAAPFRRCARARASRCARRWRGATRRFRRGRSARLPLAGGRAEGWGNRWTPRPFPV